MKALGAALSLRLESQPNRVCTRLEVLGGHIPGMRGRRLQAVFAVITCTDSSDEGGNEMTSSSTPSFFIL
jgi:hypothetical protein